MSELLGPVTAAVAFILPPALVIGLLVWLESLRRRRIYRAVQRCVYGSIEQHKDALIRRRFQLLREDDYGVLVDDKWRKEVSHFVDKVIGIQLEGWQTDFLANNRTDIEAAVRLKVERLANGREAITKTSHKSAPLDFERLCKEELERQGFRAQLTLVTGDHGADIIAERNRLRIAIQCKKYAGTVGNKAVQEIVAASRHYRCGIGIVVSTGDYTRGARQLAATNDVLLLHVSDLQDLLGILDRQRRVREAYD